jgi:hypothetical protein
MAMSNGLRFEVGEVAIFQVARLPAGIHLVGTQCTILAIGPFKKGQVFQLPNGSYGHYASDEGEYLVEFANAKPGTTMDWQLRKLNPPEEPIAMQHRKDSEKLAEFM